MSKNTKSKSESTEQQTEKVTTSAMTLTTPAMTVTAPAMAVTTPAPSANALIQTGAADFKVKQVLNIRIVSPKDLPEGAFFVGEVLGFSDSPVSTYKSRLIKFKSATGAEFFFPCTAVIARSMGLKDGKADLTGPARDRAEKAWVGRWLLIRSAGRKASTDDKAGVALFDVAEVEAPAN